MSLEEVSLESSWVSGGGRLLGLRSAEVQDRQDHVAVRLGFERRYERRLLFPCPVVRDRRVDPRHRGEIGEHVPVTDR